MTQPILAKDKFLHAIQALKPGTVQNVTTNTATSTSTTNAMAGDCAVIRVLVTTDTYVAIATTPTAASTSMYMAAGIPEYFRVEGAVKVAGRAVTSAGVMSVTEMV